MSDAHPHFEMNKLDEKKKKSMKSRVIVGVILAVTGFPSIFLGGWFFFVFISFFLGFAVFEAINAPRKKYHWIVWAFTYFITVSYVYWGMVKSNIQAYLASPDTYMFSIENHFVEPGISWYAIIASLGVYFLFGLIFKDFTIQDVTYLFAMSIFVGMGFQCILFLRYHPIAMVGIMANDDLCCPGHVWQRYNGLFRRRALWQAQDVRPRFPQQVLGRLLRRLDPWRRFSLWLCLHRRSLRPSDS